MRPDAEQPPASPAHRSALPLVLAWVVLGLLGWVVLAGLAWLTYLAVTLTVHAA